MTSLCGHDRDVLIGALQHRTKTNRPLETTTRCGCSTCTTHRAVDDPAKLAEMLAVEARRLGFDARRCDGLGIPRHRDEMTTTWHYDCEVVDVWYHKWHTFTIPTARDVLAAWMRLPEGATADAKHVLVRFNQQVRRP